jgi:hypothetical protein
MNRSFDVWEARTRLALAGLGIGYQTADPLIEDAKLHWEGSGQDPWQALGDPESFAATVRSEAPVEVRVAIDSDASTPLEYASQATFVIAALSIPIMIFVAFAERTLTFGLSQAGLTGFALIALTACICAIAPDAVRKAGRPELANWVFLPVVVLITAAAVALTNLDRDVVVRVPVVALLALAGFLIWLTTRPDPVDAPATPTVPPEYPSPEPVNAAPTVPGEHPSPESGTPRTGDAEQWFSQLHGLLIGRYDLPPDRATELVADARAHLEAAPPEERPAPEDEFGPAAQYASDLADEESERQLPWWRHPLFEVLIATVIALRMLRFTLQWFDDGSTGLAWGVGVPGTLLCSGYAVVCLLSYLRRRKQTAGRSESAS